MSNPGTALIDLTVALVRISSRGGIDSYDGIVNYVSHWLTSRGIAHEVLAAGGRATGICGSLQFAAPGNAYLLNATLDTAPFGAVSQWTEGPLSGAIRDGWLYGRGSGDSKAGLAIFLHTLAALQGRPDLCGELAFLFDADEHSGEFTGAQCFIAAHAALLRRLRGVCIGYPGHDRIVIGCRGFERARIVVMGEAAHSGAAKQRGVNAIERAARLVAHLVQLALPPTGTDGFALPAKLTVTGIEGGESFSIVPDRCSVSVDMRLTPAFSRADAHALLLRAVQWLDSVAPAPAPTQLEYVAGWPPFLTASDDPLVMALQSASMSVRGTTLPTAVAGPSNVGNLFATHGLPVTAGFGVRYRNLHAVDECVELKTLEVVAQIYGQALEKLLTTARITQGEDDVSRARHPGTG